jgi:hypothetical protein
MAGRYDFISVQDAIYSLESLGLYILGLAKLLSR